MGIPIVVASEVTTSRPRESVSTRSGRVWRPWWIAQEASPQDLGRWGEWVALKHLRKLGWDIVARNWKGYEGEVDLIAYDGPWLVFVEVKTGRGGAWPPEERVNWSKERKLDELALDFLMRYEVEETPVRLDVIGVETGDLRNYELWHYVG